MQSERVGILVVHGIGEQERFDHVRAVARDLAEHFRVLTGIESVSVVDRTAGRDDKTPASFGRCDADISVSVRQNGKLTIFAFHEVWWADLGTRTGFRRSLRFWVWGLGQWCAPIFRALKINPHAETVLPVSKNWDPGQEVMTRARLGFAGLLTVFTIATLSLLKKLVKSVSDVAPDPSLVVQYLGDVQTFEQRAIAGDGCVSDPGHPRRVPIRRRMVAETVAMATRGFNRWYILAHSLGSVVAYNALTEIEETLPNYLSREQWDSLPVSARQGDPRRTRFETRQMMPSRPAWLGDTEVVNRGWLFAKLRGFVTYGCPLDKFAAIWPRIIASSSAPTPFATNMEWLNIYTPFDPIAGRLDAFDNVRMPKPLNIAAPRALPLLAHVGYLRPSERSADNRYVKLRRELASWLLTADAAKFAYSHSRTASFVAIACNLLIAAMLAFGTALVVTLSGGLLAVVFGDGAPSPAMVWQATIDTFPAVIATALWLVLFVGLYRWFTEARRNAKLAAHDAKDALTVTFLRIQFAFAVLIGAAALALLAGPGAWADACVSGVADAPLLACDRRFVASASYYLLAPLLLGFVAMAAQAAIAEAFAKLAKRDPAAAQALA